MLKRLILLLAVLPTICLAESLTLEGPALLKGPELKASVAKTPPKVRVTIMDDLPEGPEGTLWSSWGDGCIAPNGKYYTSVGNHLDRVGGKGDGQSRVYELDPTVGELKLVVNVRDVCPDPTVAAGKIHARLEPAADGWIYFATYWGKIPTDAEWAGGFKGSGMFRYNPATAKAEFLGVPVPKQGLPTSVGDGKKLMYLYAVKQGNLVLYDMAEHEVKFVGGAELQAGDRNIMLDAEGNAYFGTKEGKIARFDRQSGTIVPTKASLPAGKTDKEKGDVLRASSAISGKGILYGMTHSGQMFAFDPKNESTELLGANVGAYTAAIAISPDDKYLYYAPGAHGSGSKLGTPVIQYDIAAKSHKVLAYLNPLLRERAKYNIGGTYNLKLSPDGSTLYVTFNGAALETTTKKEETFGKPCVVVLSIPKEER